MKIALIVARTPSQSAMFGYISQILSKKYDVHIYRLLQMPKFLSTLPARFFALLRIKSSTHSSININSKKQVNIKATAMSRACMCFKSVSAKLIIVPKMLIARFYLYILSFYIALKYDLVISHDIHWPGAISTLCAKFFRKKSIVFVVGHYFDEIKIRHTGISGLMMLKILSILEFISIHLADIIVSGDYRDTEHLKGRRTKKMVFWKKFGTVNLQRFSYDDKIKKMYRKKLGIPNADPVLLSVGWLSEWYGTDTAFNVYRTLAQEKEDLWIIFIGSGDLVGSGILEEHIKRTILKENLQKVILTGYIPHSEIHNCMMTGDIALMPLREPQCGIGNVNLELMALGIPIIATDVGMFREVIIDGETGFIVKDDIIGEMVQKIKILIDHPDLISKMRINARKMVEQDFSSGSISAKVFSLIDSCMDS